SYDPSIKAKNNLLHYEREYVVRQVQTPSDKAPSFRKLESAILPDEKVTAVPKKVDQSTRLAAIDPARKDDTTTNLSS
ncbi:MAG TPA: hypothetical protein VGE83_02285, partial [Terracidiphilus sp.]